MMMKTILPAFAVTLALALPLPALAQEPTKVREVAVTADLTAIGNPRAATYWSDIADDLHNAILARVTDRIGEDGVDINVKLSTVELASAFENLANLGNSQMRGQVNVTSKTDNSAFNSYDLTVSMDQALPYFPAGTTIAVITLDNRDYYTAMISAFAQAVVDRL